MNNFELFEKIISGDLRPHKFESDGKVLQDKIEKLEINAEDFSKYLKYKDEQGEKYSLKITNIETGETLLDEKRNDEFNELIDLDIPPEPDKKGEQYLELVEFEYARNIITIDEFIRENEHKKIEEYAIKNFQFLRNFWKDLKLYKKLIIEGKELDYEKSNDYVIIILQVYIERTVVHLLNELGPYLNSEYKDTIVEEIFGEKQRRLKEIEELILKIETEKAKEKKKIRLANEIIADEVVKHWDEGLEEFEEIYSKLSESSEKIFGVKLTIGQIKGRYQRYAKKNKDYRREKY